MRSACACATILCESIFFHTIAVLRNDKKRMDQIGIKAYGKVNLGLDVTGRRADGYHLVKMVMQTVDVHDDITITRMPSSESSVCSITLSCQNPLVPADHRNLAFKAAEIICRDHGINAAIHIDIRKNIPMEAGMAGGSADGAAVIKGMNDLFSLGMDWQEMDRTALLLGADVPFCLRKGTYLAEGVGEKLAKLPDLMPCHMVIVKPQISVSTPWAYRELDALMAEPDGSTVHPDIDGIIRALTNGDLAEMTLSMGNILEGPVIRKYEEIGEIKSALLQNGAAAALMSGSGSAVFGIFGDPETAQDAFLNIRGEGYDKFKVEFR